MFADASSTYSPSNAQGVGGPAFTSNVQNVPKFSLPSLGTHGNLILGAIVTIVILYLVHRASRGRRR